MPKCALPSHLKDKLHRDWVWPLNKISRGWNAYGPRCGKGNDGYLAWPPKLEEGKSICRWENSRATSIIEIPALRDNTAKGSDVYGQSFQAIERNKGHENFGKSFLVKLEWREVEVRGDWDMKPEDQTLYFPSSLQKFSFSGWMKLSPKYFSAWKVLKKRELPIWPETGEDSVLFTRSGNRPDAVDLYYNVDKILPVGQLGLKWE